MDIATSASALGTGEAGLPEPPSCSATSTGDCEGEGAALIFCSRLVDASTELKNESAEAEGRGGVDESTAMGSQGTGLRRERD